MGSSQEKIRGQGRDLRKLMNQKKQTQKNWLIFWAFAVSFIANVALAQEPSKIQSSQAVLLTRLASGSEEQRVDAVIELGSMLSVYKAEQQTIESLGSLLQKDSSLMVRALAARAMELSRDDKFTSALLASLKIERELSVRKAIVYALAFHRSAQVVSALTPLLKDKKQEIRAVAAFALAEIADPASTTALIDLLKKRGKDEDVFARSQAARGLGRLADKSSLDALANSLLRDKSSEVRRACAQSLGLIANNQDMQALEALKAAKLDADPYLVLTAEIALNRVNARSH